MLRHPVSCVDAVHRGKENGVVVVAIESVGLRVVERRRDCGSGCVVKTLMAEFGLVFGGLGVSLGASCAWMLRLIVGSIHLPHRLLRCFCVCWYLMEGCWYSYGQVSGGWSAQ